MDIHMLPTLNATLNGLAGVFLFFGWRAIKAGNQRLHQKLMVCALAASSAFLISYITYHALVRGVTHYTGQGIWRGIYFFILLTHTPLAVLIVPFSLTAVWHALKKNFSKHTRITKWLLPVWMYVSVTGVLIYLMLYIF